MPDLDLRLLLESWQLHLRAERKSRETLRAYTTGVEQFLAFCDDEGIPAILNRRTVNSFIAELLDTGAEPSTARSRQLAVRRFSAWLEAEGELERDELVGIKPPKLNTKITPRLTDEQCTDLIAACKGKDFRDRRDEAIVRFMLEAIVRAGEVVGMTVPEVDLKRCVASVHGKGGKSRVVPFGAQTATAIDRYLRARRTHRLADTPTLWLGDRGKTLSYQGLYVALKYRAQLAGIADFHPHVTRHTASQRWLAAGGSEGGLMTIAGWSRRDMVDRYTRATAAERAVNEARGLNLGDM